MIKKESHLYLPFHPKKLPSSYLNLNTKAKQTKSNKLLQSPQKQNIIPSQTPLIQISQTAQDESSNNKQQQTFLQRLQSAEQQYQINAQLNSFHNQLSLEQRIGIDYGFYTEDSVEEQHQAIIRRIKQYEQLIEKNKQTEYDEIKYRIQEKKDKVDKQKSNPHVFGNIFEVEKQLRSNCQALRNTCANIHKQSSQNIKSLQQQLQQLKNSYAVSTDRQNELKEEREVISFELKLYQQEQKQHLKLKQESGILCIEIDKQKQLQQELKSKLATYKSQTISNLQVHTKYIQKLQTALKHKYYQQIDKYIAQLQLRSNQYSNKQQSLQQQILETNDILAEKKQELDELSNHMKQQCSLLLQLSEQLNQQDEEKSEEYIRTRRK